MAKPSKPKPRKRTSSSGKKASSSGRREPTKKNPKPVKATKRTGNVRERHGKGSRSLGKNGKRGNVKTGAKPGVSGRKVAKKKVVKKSTKAIKRKPTPKKPTKPTKRKPAAKKPAKPTKRKPATPKKPTKPTKRKLAAKKPTKPTKRKPAAKKPAKPTKRKPAIKKPAKPTKRKPTKPTKSTKRKPTPKPTKRKPSPKKPGKPRPPKLPISQAALLAEERAIEWLSRFMSFVDAGNLELGAAPGELSLGIKSFVNRDGTVDAEIRISDLPHLWQVEEGRVAMSEFLSIVLRKAGILTPEKEAGGYYISIGIRFGRAGNTEDLAELYKRHRGLFQVAAHPTSMHFISGIMNNVVSISVITDSLRKKRGLPPAVIFLRITWTPTGERPERYLGERGGGN